ncbi:MAG: hypothetical protein JXB30_09400 [Anaerolineae bacterium]|nr:hypothetical protein [Anaerolineae bacterium]
MTSNLTKKETLMLSGRDAVKKDNSSLVISYWITSITALGFVISAPAFIHWFLIPIVLSGILIGVDAIDWFRGRLDILDPIGILGLLGYHFFCIAPLLQISWNYEPRYIVPPPDWRPWIGGIALLNFLGLVVYRISRGKTSTIPYSKDKIVWQRNKKIFLPVLTFSLLLTLGIQILVYEQHGGVSGYIADSMQSRETFTGQGWIFTISESFPVLALMGYAVYAREKKWAKSWLVICCALLVYFALKMLFGGLRGSRSNTIWGMFWAIGIIHFRIRSIPKRLIYAGLVFLFVFMYLYGFYKAVGLDALAVLENRTARIELEEETGRTVETLLLADFARSPTQAFLLYRIWPASSDYEYSWGRTYIGALALLIPRQIWPDRPPSKVKEGTEAQYGKGSYLQGGLTSSRIYGLAGEAMLNFGPFAVPLAFTILGLTVKQVRRWFLSWESHDIRLLLLPLLINLCFVVLAGDSDLILFFIIKNGVVPFLVLWISSTKQVLSHASHSGA